MRVITLSLAWLLFLLPNLGLAQQEAQASQDTLLLQSSVTGQIKTIAPGRRILVQSRQQGTVNGHLATAGNTVVMFNTADMRKEFQHDEIQSITLRRLGWRVVSVLAILGFYVMMGFLLFLLLFLLFGLIIPGFFGGTLLFMLGFLILLLIATPLSRQKFKMTTWKILPRRPGS
jgi:hypothetical protein